MIASFFFILMTLSVKTRSRNSVCVRIFTSVYRLYYALVLDEETRRNKLLIENDVLTVWVNGVSHFFEGEAER